MAKMAAGGFLFLYYIFISRVLMDLNSTKGDHASAPRSDPRSWGYHSHEGLTNVPYSPDTTAGRG